jgi:S1-C subfamily serine protease
MKWGIRRGKELLIITFKKGDPEKMKSGKRIMLRMDDTKGNQPGEKGKFQFTMEKGSELNPELANLGLILAAENQQLKVIHIMEHAIPEVKTAIQAGDILLMLKGTNLTSVDDFIKGYEKISVGQMVQMKVLRGEKAFELTFKKPESRVKIIMQKGKPDEK